MDKIGLILLALVALAVFACGAQYVRGLFFSTPCRFRYGEDTFIWVPDDPEGLPFFRKHAEYGSFQYEDGTPVSDLGLQRMLRDYWIAQHPAGDYQHQSD